MTNFINVPNMKLSLYGTSYVSAFRFSGDYKVNTKAIKV